MNHLFSKPGMAALRDFAASGALVALDYDGTLTPIREHPREAVLARSMCRQLEELRRVLPTVIVTGRASSELRPLLGDLHDIDIIGNHGAETSALIPPDVQARVTAWREALEDRLLPLEGVMVEDKGYSLSVHYRLSRDWADARDSITQAARELSGARIFGGKAVINIVLREAPNKGTAVLMARQRANTSRVIYVGDDVTDEDVFSLKRPDEILTVHVGPATQTQAEYHVRDIEEVRELLELLARLAHGERL
ncbi:MAG TPA: trehalose-phosphatase [Gammaproteobacteria bacterium]|nr:trehalose-phosphatase [Gammaproteobacteria bacterium]